MNKPENEKVIHIELDQFVKSATNRKTFTPTALSEMADSILEKGVVQPIIARLVTAIEDEERRAAALKAGAKYEIVAGERRWRGSKLATKATIPTIVRNLNDHDALLTQAIENAQRENPQPLEEAAQYDELLRMGQTNVKELALRTGKSHTYIYGRVSLLRLPDKMKTALRDNKVSLPVAQLVARIPNPVVVEEAAKRILRGDSFGRPVSVHDAQRFIFEQCMMLLKGAPFDPKDKTLVPEAGPCALCPKRTGNEKELFADIGRSDVCTDTVCFRAKCDAARTRLLENAKAEGKAVLSPEESAQLFPHHGHLSFDAPYVELSQPCPFAPKKTWGDVIAKLPKAERPEIAVAVDQTGALHELVGRKEAGEVARALDLAKPAETRGSLSPESVSQRRQARESRERHEHTIRAVDLAITAVVEKQAKTRDTKTIFRLLRVLAMKEANFDSERRVAKRHVYVTPKKDGDVRQYYARLAKQAEAEPVSFILETLLWHNSLFAARGLPETMTTACKIYGIDPKKIETVAKEKPAKADEASLPALKK